MSYVLFDILIVFFIRCYTPSGTLYILSTIGAVLSSEIIFTNPESSPHIYICLT